MTTFEDKARKNGPGESSDFSAPLGAVKSGRLVFTSGASQVSLTVSGTMHDLYRARFKRRVPSVWLHDGILTIQYKRFTPVYSHQPLAEISLNVSIPWEIEFHQEVSGLKAELGGLQLRSLDILGGASHIELLLSKPAGTTFIYVSGGISRGDIRRPGGVGVRVRVDGGVSELVFDTQYFGAVGGETSLESVDFVSATGRYDVCIAGGASRLTIGEEMQGVENAL